MKAVEAGDYGRADDLRLDALRPDQAPSDHAAGHSMESLREADHQGHHIEIRTTYSILVDGRPLPTHVVVNNDGTLHSHALPNYTFASAVNMVKKIIDYFPEEFESRSGEGHHDGHAEEHPR